MPANLQGLELTDSSSNIYSFEVFKEDETPRGVSISSRDWELGDPLTYWKVPLFPFDGGLRQDRLPTTVSLTTEFNRARSYTKANMDASNEGVLVPPPLVDSTALTNTTTAIKQVPFDSKQFFLCGRYIYTKNRSGTLTLDKDFGSGKEAVDFAVFNNELIIAMGESEKIWKRAVGGTYTQASDNTFAIAVGTVGTKLWRAANVNQLSSCTTAPLTLASWTPADPNEYTAGDLTYSIHGIIEYSGVPAVLRPDGVFMPDSLSNYHNQAPQMADWPHTDNGKGAFNAQGFLWVPSAAGLIRISQGESLLFGPEKSNRPDYRFWVRGGVEWGEHIYLLVTDEIGFSETFICKMTRDTGGITGRQYIYHEWVRLGSVDKGYSIGINTWPSSGPIAEVRDAGTIATVADANVAWADATNAAASDNSYATVVYTGGEGTSEALRFSNFGFSIPSDATLLGYIVNIERKTSAGPTSPSVELADATVENDTGFGTKAWTIDIDGPDFSFASISNSTSVFSNYLKFSSLGFAIPSTATITGVTVTLARVRASGVVVDSIVRLLVDNVVVGENKAVVPGWPGTAAEQVYGSTTDMWNTTLTPDQVNDAEFGFVVAALVGTSSQGIIWAETGALVSEIAVTYTIDGTVDSDVRMIGAGGTGSGDNEASGSSWPTVDTVATYGGEDQLWGTTFTVADTADTDFGFHLIVENPVGITASVDYGSLTIVYQEADISTNPTLFAGCGTTIKHIKLGFGSGDWDIDDPSYPFGLTGEIETGLIQPTQDVTLVSGLIGVSMVALIRDTDSITLQYALGAADSYTNLLTTQEGSGTAPITGTGIYEQVTRYAAPNITGPYFKFKLSGTFGSGAGTDRFELRNLWAYGYSRPKVTDILTIPVYCDRMAFNANGIPQGDTGGDTLRYFRKWKRDQEVLTFRFPDYEMGRTIRVRVVDVGSRELITEKMTDGMSRQTFIANISFMRDDFANAYGDA